MHSVTFSKLCIAVFTVVLNFDFTNSIDIDNHQGIPDLIYFINGSYKQENLSRYTRQNTQACRIPRIPLHTSYKIIGKTVINLSAGDYAENYNLLQIICESGYSINPIAQSHSFCLDGQWSPPLPNCLRACPSLNSIASTNVQCKWTNLTGNTIPLSNCKNPVEGTTAFLSCHSWYEEPNIEKNPIRVCRQGKWDPYIPECYPMCGVKRPKGMTNIINGTTAEPGDYPWQIAIYNTKKEFLCGGSILGHRVVLSAAHCFTDFEGNKKPIENYLIAAGKYYRIYDDERDKFAQYSKILEIHIPIRYKGQVSLQGFDIAVIILTSPLKISPFVQPVCIELNEKSKSLNLALYKYGIVTGWGYTVSGRDLSEVLKEIVIPYIPYEECIEMVPSNFRRYITHDKICGGYINSSKGVCGGDSGGSYIFKKIDSDRHFVKGLVSVGPATVEGVCDPNQYSVYTFVDDHIDFIRQHYTYNQIYQGLECKPDDCNKELPNENAKIDCTLPNFSPDGTYSLSNNEIYTPGGHAEISSVLSLKCNTGYLFEKNTSLLFSCSDKGNWVPPLTTCAEEPNEFCTFGHIKIKKGTSSPLEIGSCGQVTCLEEGEIFRSICPVLFRKGCSNGPYDYTKLYPDCCPRQVC